MKKILSIIVNIGILIVLFAGIQPVNVLATGTTYFISSSNGNDNNNGQSSATAWKSFKNLATIRLGPGDKVLLKRGDSWNERMTLYAKGTSDNWVYVAPYGKLSDSTPTISLNNSRDSICILVQDYFSNDRANSNYGISYIHIDNIRMLNSRLGIYFRFVCSSKNTGIKVTNCQFDNIDCPDVFNELEKNPTTDQNAMMQKLENELMLAKGNLLLPPFGAERGGSNEYVFPSAILIGGLTSAKNNTNTEQVISNIEIDNNEMTRCTGGITSWFYKFNSGFGDTNCSNVTKNWRITNIKASYPVNGTLAIGNADGGWDGTNNSYWGIVRNVNITEGHPNRILSVGTTAAIFDATKNFLFENNNFSNVRNNSKVATDSGDGCGIDIEGSRNITMRNNILSNNQGESILMATGSSGTSKGVVIENNLFYNNLQHIGYDHYVYDLCVWSSYIQNGVLCRDYLECIIRNNRFITKPTTQGTGGSHTIEAIVGPDDNAKIVKINNGIIRTENLPDFMVQVNEMGLSSALNLPIIKQVAFDSPSSLGSNTSTSKSTNNSIITNKSGTSTTKDSKSQINDSNVQKNADSSQVISNVDNGENNSQPYKNIIIVIIIIVILVLTFISIILINKNLRLSILNLFKKK